MNYYYNYKKWRLSRLNTNHHDPLTPHGLLSSYPESLHHPDIKEGESAPITKEQVDKYPEQFGPHVLDMPAAEEQHINDLLGDIKYMGVTKEGSAFPHIYYSSTRKNAYEPSENIFSPNTYIDKYLNIPRLSAYVGLTVYNALKHPTHRDFSSYIDESEESNPLHYAELAKLSEMKRDNIFQGKDIPKTQDQPDDDYHNKIELYRKIMGHIASSKHSEYINNKFLGFHPGSFSDYLEEIPKSGNKLYDLLISKLKSMSRGDHLS